MKTRRNQPCICGSGIKSKRCCETPAKQVERNQTKNKAFRDALKKRREEFLKSRAESFPIDRRRLSHFSPMLSLMLAMGMGGRRI